MDMPTPAEFALLEEGDRALEPGSTVNIGVLHEVWPFDGQNRPQVSQMECVELISMFGVECPNMNVNASI